MWSPTMWMDFQTLKNGSNGTSEFMRTYAYFTIKKKCVLLICEALLPGALPSSPSPSLPAPPHPLIQPHWLLLCSSSRSVPTSGCSLCLKCSLHISPGLPLLTQTVSPQMSPPPAGLPWPPPQSPLPSTLSGFFFVTYITTSNQVLICLYVASLPTLLWIPWG